MNNQALDKAIQGFLAYLETGAGASEVFTDDVFLDFTIPLWRLRARGRNEVHALRRRGHPDPGTVAQHKIHRTAGGFAMEAEERWRNAQGDTGSTVAKRRAIMRLPSSESMRCFIRSVWLGWRRPWKKAT